MCAGVGQASDLPFYVYWFASNMDQSLTAPQFLDAMKAVRAVSNFALCCESFGTLSKSTCMIFPKVPHFAGFKFTSKDFYMFQQLHYTARMSGTAVCVLWTPRFAVPLCGTQNMHLHGFISSCPLLGECRDRS